MAFLTSGAAVNFILIVAGSLVGISFKKGMPERFNKILITAMSLCVLYIGINGIMAENINMLYLIISLAIGAIIGELIDIDNLMNKLGAKIEKSFTKCDNDNKIAQGFVTASLVFCIGAMAIVGSIDSGISGDNSTLYSKSIIDCISAVAFSSVLGIGVALSAIPVFILEGGLTLIAAAVSPFLSTTVVDHISVVGSILIIALSLNLLGITKIKIANLVPAVFIPILLCNIF